jgi:hypothetical protein
MGLSKDVIDRGFLGGFPGGIAGDCQHKCSVIRLPEER